MLVTLDTSHLEMSLLNNGAAGRCQIFFISVTAETSQYPTSPCGPLEQSLGDSSRQSLMAVWSSALDFGAHSVVRYCGRRHTVGVALKITMIVRIVNRVGGT